MKRIKNLMLLLMAVFACGMMTSCDEDLHEAMAISGEWRGDFGMFYVYTWQDARGRIHEETFESYDTRIVFYPHHDYATYGTGTQVDYYDYGPYSYQYYHFTWRVDNRILYLYYPYDHELDTYISDCTLSESRGLFTGYFANTNNRFTLYKMSDYYDWSPYRNDYGYYDRFDWGYGYYYSPSFSRAESDTLAATADAESLKGVVVSRGNRYAGQ